VRELENVIERAVIVARDGRLCLDDAFPGPALADGAVAAAPEPGAPAEILTADEVTALERDNMRRALEAAGWKVSGEHGAAARLGLKPSTLTSRMKALGLARPPRD
jgi:transcriptional regulator with GAF, ATPase, and Fis domain